MPKTTMLPTLLALALSSPSPSLSDILPRSNGCRIEIVARDGKKHVTNWGEASPSDLARAKRQYPRAHIYKVCI